MDMQDIAVEAARFIAAHACEPIVLADVADHVGYSPFYLARSFERHLGVTPGQFLAAHRFQWAKRLLLSGDERVIDVCFAVGFTSVGTFTTRFAAAVGSSPTAFRRLPHLLADSPPRPVVVPGAARRGGVVTGSAYLSPAASAALGGAASVYVGLFPRRSARGFPVSGSLLAETGDFVLTDVPPGTYWVLASALPTRADIQTQLVPARSVLGSSTRPVRIAPDNLLHYRDVHLDVAEGWSAPVLVALPPLASACSQDWRRREQARVLG
jgi:AraC-like DNA-binding protein